MSSDRVLPPKSLATIGLLERQRADLSRAIATRCMDKYECHDLPLAKDLVRSYTCSFYDTLKEFYSNKVTLWECEVEIAAEAIQNAFACWKNFNYLSVTDFSVADLQRDIAIHIGHALRSGLIRIPLPATSVQEAPLLVMATAAARHALTDPQPQTPTQPTFSEELGRLLSEARWKPEVIAEKVGIVPRNVYRHLSGETKPTLSNIGSYEAALTKKLGRKIVLPTPVKRQRASNTSAKRH